MPMTPTPPISRAPAPLIAGLLGAVVLAGCGSVSSATTTPKHNRSALAKETPAEIVRQAVGALREARSFP